MGFAVAEALAAQGAEVELVTGPTQMVTTTAGIHRHDVECAREMLAEATRLFPTCVGAILTAAVADYRPEHTVDHKLKKQGDEGMTLRLVQNPDILATLGTMKQTGQTLVGFALETDNEETNARGKMERKNADYIVLNSLRDKGAGFGVETNRVTIMSREGEAYKSALMSKREVADLIVERCLLK
jgi:phosphopantothenoylcysteine decarboxylase/phosphopantothenate--cysteine ligase